MNRLAFVLLVLLVLLAGSKAGAQVATQRITLTITVTNRAVTSNTLVVNASTRIWTNASTATTIQTNLVSTATTATNLYNQIANFPYSGGIFPRWLSETSLALVGPLGGALAASQSGNWCILTLVTQSGPLTFTALWPMENMAGNATNKTNQASAFVSGMSTFSTQAFATNSTAVSNLLQKGAGPQQYVAAAVQFNGTLRAAGAVALTNGFTSATTNINSVSSNGVNYGNAFRSEGSGGASLQLGSNAVASGLRAVAVGVNASASQTDAVAVGTTATAATNGVAVGNGAATSTFNGTAVGTTATASGMGATALGHIAIASGLGAIAIGELPTATADYAISIGNEDTLASGTNSLAMGRGANATGQYSLALGAGSLANQNFSTAIGANDSAGQQVVVSTTNQIRLGTSIQQVSVPGALEAATVRSLNAVGTNAVTGIFAFSVPLVVSSVAVGHNVIDTSTNTILYLTGSPGAAWTLGGFTGNKTDGRELEVWNQTGFDVTIQNESGTTPTANERITTYSSPPNTNATLVGNGLMKFRYSTTAARWLLRFPMVDITASGTNGINSISTNGVAVSSAATALNIIGNESISVERATNTAGAVSIQFAPVLFRCTNFGTLYNGGEWEQIVNEEWIGDQDATTSGTMGTHAWAANSSGTLPALSAPILESNVWAYISVVTTQTTSMRTYSASYTSAGFATGWTATNCEYFMHARLRMNSTNKTTDVARNIFGLYTSGTIGEPAAGIYVMNNTNVNTNTWIACTTQASTGTRNYSTIATYDNMTWTDVGIYVDRTGTNAVFMYGPDRFRYTSFATNVSNLPGSSSGMGPAWQVERIASVDGNNFRTNYCDFIKVWVRRFL